MRSSTKRAHDSAARTDRIGRGALALSELSASLSSTRCRLKSRVAVEDAANAALAATSAARWLRFEVGEQVSSEFRQERRGRPGPETRYRRIDRSRFTLCFFVDATQVGVDACSDGCFPFVTNEKAMTPAELLVAYKAQPHIERRHPTLKGVIEAAPIELKSDHRIDALAFCLYAALLTHALIERELRRAMAAAGIAELPLYYEDRSCKSPTATRVLEMLDHLTRTVVRHRGELLAVHEPSLSPLQEQILNLLDVPTDPYGSLRSAPNNSG